VRWAAITGTLASFWQRVPAETTCRRHDRRRRRPAPDTDLDGWADFEDCGPLDPERYPGAPEPQGLGAATPIDRLGGAADNVLEGAP
jgi:hypothetical protein